VIQARLDATHVTGTMAGLPAIVLFGDVVGSRQAPAAAAGWLRRLCFELEGVYEQHRLAPFAFTQGDEIQGLLSPDADPLLGVLYASLHESAQPMRWAVVHGRVQGEGRATEWGGDAYLRARRLVEQARSRHDGLLMLTGDAPADELLEELSPVLAELLLGLSPRQRTVARLALIEGLRQSEVAERLGVSRATVSVTYGRARVRSIGRVAAAVRTVFRAGLRAAAA
jgi:RNA polymerase sigma factor (sigma-70 family)